MIFKQARERYFSREASSLRSPETAAYALGYLGRYLDPVPLERIYHDCRELVRMRSEWKGKAKSLNRKIDVLRRVLNLASRKWRDEDGGPYLNSVPLIAHVKGPSRLPHILTYDEQERLIAECPDHLKDAILFAVNTGMRAGEQRQLRWDWETDDGGFFLPATVTKTGKARYVPSNKIAKECVERCRGNDPDFVWTYDGAPIGRRFNNHAFRRARKRAKVDVTWHYLRHTFATRARATGAALTDVAAILGHEIPGLEMTSHYSRPDPRALNRVVVQLGRARKATKATRPLRVSEGAGGRRVGS